MPFEGIHVNSQHQLIMAKRGLVILLILSLTLSEFQRIFVYAGFKINQGYIAKNFCINRSKPWMHCNGRCYFMRKLKAAEENEKKQTEKDNLNRLEVCFFQSVTEFNFEQNYSEHAAIMGFLPYNSSYNDPYQRSLYRPPQV
jgi:hypothetical protein